MPFGKLVVEGVIRAITPVVHGGNEKTGNMVTLNRMTFIIDDEPVDVPIISGNAIRGVLRRYIMQDFLEQIGYEIDVESPYGRKLYHTLFAGGLLEEAESSMSGVIDVRLKQAVLKYIPPIRLLGGSFINQTFEGKLKVFPALPICTELVGTYIPDREEFRTNRSFYEYLTKIYQTRKDELREPKKKGEQAVQMIIEYEAFASGTKFYHRFVIEDPEPLDVSIFARMLELWKIKPYVGGKSAIGFGEIEFSYNFDGSSEQYLNYLKDNREKIIEVLESLMSLSRESNNSKGGKKRGAGRK